MASKSLNLPLVIIVGPTASGKTSLSIELAKKYGGEIISADSRAIYKGMDIGTAKPTAKEQKGVPHWGLDLVEPGEYFSAADFKKYANQKINEIRQRGNIPFLVGGTGLYVDAIFFDYQFGLPANIEIRSKLQHMEVDDLINYCKSSNILLPENFKNKRYLIRSIENNGIASSKNVKPLNNSIIVGIATERGVLRSRIEQRADQLFNNGVVDEARFLGDRYGWDNEAMKSNIYPLIRQYIIGELSLDEISKKFTTLDWRLAKRQMTWMKRNSFIKWLELDDAKKYLNEQLAILK